MESLSEVFNNDKEIEIQQKIVEELLNSQNLDSKTELQKPMKWSILRVIISFLESKKLLKSSKILDEFVNTSFKYLISLDRKGRIEYIQALQAVNEKEKDKDNTIIKT